MNAVEKPNGSSRSRFSSRREKAPDSMTDSGASPSFISVENLFDHAGNFIREVILFFLQALALLITDKAGDFDAAAQLFGDVLGVLGHRQMPRL